MNPLFKPIAALAEPTVSPSLGSLDTSAKIQRLQPLIQTSATTDEGSQSVHRKALKSSDCGDIGSSLPRSQTLSGHQFSKADISYDMGHGVVHHRRPAVSNQHVPSLAYENPGMNGLHDKICNRHGPARAATQTGDFDAANFTMMNAHGKTSSGKVELTETITTGETCSARAPQSGCVRCPFFERRLAVRTFTSFYCDVGMKAVLRAVRRHLLKTMSISAKAAKKST